MIIVRTLLSITDVGALECFSCSNISDATACNTTVTCTTGQACYQESIVSGQNNIVTLGCVNKKQCGVAAGGPGTLVGRNVKKRQENKCQECCATDRCNNILCARRNPAACIDDKTIDCPRMNSVFGICKDINHAKYLCPNFCGLCNVVNLTLNGPAEEFITISANSPLNLNCSITGSPPPTFTWSKQHSCGGSYQSYKGSFLHESARATSGDSGTYTCSASNGPLNNVSKIFHVEVNVTGFEDKCTFDTGSLCDWQQVSTDEFNWTIHSGPTQSVDTGPNADHTQTGSGQHRYVYIEASSPRTKGENADLISHMLPANQTKCLTLWYYMYGTDTGDLKVFLEDQCTHKRTEVLSETGDKGQKWLKGSVIIPASTVPNDYKIVIRGTIGSSYHGDTALDDIYIQDYPCYGTVRDCDFSYGICQWTQAKNDDFDWTRLTGYTPSSATGPSGDHTRPNGGGYYMYIESSQPSITGDVAILQSPTLPAGQDYCFSLATNMYGDTMGSIAVIVKSTAPSGSGANTLANYSTSSTTEQWKEHNIYIPAQTNSFQILIKGTIGSGYRSDAAIDDLSIKHSGKC